LLLVISASNIQVVGATGGPVTAIARAGPASQPLLPAMQAAAAARQVPLPLIEAVAYVDTKWEWIATPAGDKGVGLLNVLPEQIGPAAALSGHSPAQIAADPAANLDAGAALLAAAHTGGADLGSWRPAVVSTQGPYVAQQIYDVLGSGATRTTSGGETITLAPPPLPPQNRPAAPGTAAAATAAPSAASSDYPPAAWVPASTSNYSTADRPHDYPVDLIIIHDIEGSYGSAIQEFQNPSVQASAHYVVSSAGQVTQMVAEHDIAWHAGNWDYNTRAIGIEHEGFASQPLYTVPEYQASAALAASICSRWGVPLDRNHVIGHYQVPDPNNPGLFGGAGHHTDPGPYWDWSYYMGQAQFAAKSLPSLPHFGPDPQATNGVSSVTVTWQAARDCQALPITYRVVGQPGGVTQDLPAGSTSATFNGLQQGVSYTFTVTALDSQGAGDSLTSNAASPGACTTAALAAGLESPQTPGTPVRFTAGSTVCPNPLYEFWVQSPGTDWQLVQPYSTSAVFDWSTTGKPTGVYDIQVWAKDATSRANYDAFGTGLNFTLGSPACTATAGAAAPTSVRMTDLFTYDPSASGSCVELASGGGGWSGVIGPVFSSGWHFYPGHYSSSGLTDLFLYNPSTGSSYVELANGLGGWSGVAGPTFASGWQFYPGRYSGSGLTDLFLYNPTTGYSYVERANGIGGWSGVAGPTFSTGWQIYPGVYNGDGLSDLFLYNPTNGRSYVEFANGSGGWSGVSGPVFSTGWQFYPGYYSGSGLTDLFLYDATAGKSYVEFASGAGTWSGIAGPMFSAGWDVYPGNYDSATNLTGLFLYNPAGGWTYTESATGGGGWSSVAGPPFAPGWSIFPGHYTAGSGLNGLFLYNESNGSSYVEMASGSGAWYGVPGPQVSTGWGVVTGDFDGR